MSERKAGERNTYVFMASRVFTREFEVEADSYEEACEEAQNMVFNDGDRDFTDSLTDHPERTEVSYSGYLKEFPDGRHPVTGYPKSDGGYVRLAEEVMEAAENGEDRYDGAHDFPKLLFRKWEGDDRLYEF